MNPVIESGSDDTPHLAGREASCDLPLPATDNVD